MQIALRVLPAGLVLGLFFAGCSDGPYSTCDMPISTVQFTNYDRVAADSTRFLLSAYTITLDEQDFSAGVHVDTSFGAMEYLFFHGSGGSLSMELIRDSASKVRVTGIELQPMKVLGECRVSGVTHRKFSIVWEPVKDTAGYHQYALIEE